MAPRCEGGIGLAIRQREPPWRLLVQFHLLSFEGPDAYARAGGIASRIEGLAQALDAAGQEAHLWFIGDPAAPPRSRGPVDGGDRRSFLRT